MKEVKNDVIKKYEVKVVDDIYYVYVVEHDSYYEFYLQRYSYGTIRLMVGILKNKYSYESMLKMVKEDLIDYIHQYRDDIGE